LLLRRWGRACAIFGVVAGLAMMGYLLRGVVFPIHLHDLRADPLNFLGGVGDAGSGISTLSRASWRRRDRTSRGLPAIMARALLPLRASRTIYALRMRLRSHAAGKHERATQASR
jgi:hypothetical protein